MLEFQKRRVLRLFVLLLGLSVPVFAGAREITLKSDVPFRFVAYGDTRFTDRKRVDVSNAEVRQTLVRAITDASPSFICISGDLVRKGDSSQDWRVWDEEIVAWRDRSIPIFPVLGNHDLRGNMTRALTNYFERFPEIQRSRYYSVRAANILVLVLDSSLPELTGPQGEWLRDRLAHLDDVKFVVLILHHPPYTTSSPNITGGGHGARQQETKLAQWLESKQVRTRARFVVFAGHVHNYEHYEHGGVQYFVTGGGGAHPYKVARSEKEPRSDQKINYHYLTADVENRKMIITMNRLVMNHGKATWTQPDKVAIEVPDTTAKE